MPFLPRIDSLSRIPNLAKHVVNAFYLIWWE